MWYKEALAMRRSLIVYAIAIAALAAINAWAAGDQGGLFITGATLTAAAITTSILALFVGTNLGSERGSASRSALLRPISREGYALTIFAVDIAGLLLAYFTASALFIGTYQVAHGFPPLDLSGVSVFTCLVLPFGAIVALYGITTALCVGTRGSRLVAALVGPIAIVLWIGATAQVQEFAKLFQVFCIANPVMYLMTAIELVEKTAHPNTLGVQNSGFFLALPLDVDALALYALAIGALLIATFAWKRAEA